MGKYFEKMFYWDEFIEICNHNKIYYVGYESNEPRADNKSKIQDLSKERLCEEILLEYNYENDIFTYNGTQYNLKKGARELLESLDKSVPIMLNITSLNLRLLGALLYHLKKLNYEKIYCMYTEPLRYCKNQDISENSENVNRFDLYKKFRGIEPIPGFLRKYDGKLEERWVAFLGFEGKRLEQIYDIYEFQNIVPVITLPSYQPGWHNYAFDENLNIIKLADRKPEYIIANSYMSSYNYLEKMLQSSKNLYIRVSPCGTKVNALGALLFSLNNTKNIEILYDNPIEEGKISSDCGKTYVFDISEILNYKGERKNESDKAKF